MTTLKDFEIKVAKRCDEHENDCNSCPMNTACNAYSKAETEKEKMDALGEMLFSEIQSLIQELCRLEEISNDCYEKWDKDPMNAELEKAADDSYQAEFAMYIQTSNTLAEMLGIDVKTARNMLCNKRPEVLALLDRVEA